MTHIHCEGKLEEIEAKCELRNVHGTCSCCDFVDSMIAHHYIQYAWMASPLNEYANIIITDEVLLIIINRRRRKKKSYGEKCLCLFMCVPC